MAQHHTGREKFISDTHTSSCGLQVQYHAAKKKEGSSPRVESLLKDLEKDVERRERFLRECGRMVGSFPEIEEEVTWRVEHVMAKWDMLSKLRIKPRTEETDIPDIYSGTRHISYQGTKCSVV